MRKTRGKITIGLGVMLIAFPLSLIIGCSQKGESIYQVFMSNLRNASSCISYNEAWGNLDLLRKENPAFRKADTTIEFLERRINSALVAKMDDFLQAGIEKPDSVYGAYMCWKIINKYSPSFTISENGKTLSTSAFLSLKALSNIKDILLAFDTVTFWSIDELHEKVHSDSLSSQAYFALFDLINNKEGMSIAQKLINNWRESIPLKTEKIKKEMVVRMAKYAGTYLYKENEDDKDVNNSVGGLSERIRYIFRKDGSVSYVFDHDGSVNGVLHYVFTLYKEGTWELSKEQDLQIDYKKIKVVDHGSSDRPYGYWKSSPRGRGIWIKFDELKDDDPEKSNSNSDQIDMISAEDFDKKFRRIN